MVYSLVGVECETASVETHREIETTFFSSVMRFEAGAWDPALSSLLGLGKGTSLATKAMKAQASGITPFPSGCGRSHTLGTARLQQPLKAKTVGVCVLGAAGRKEGQKRREGGGKLDSMLVNPSPHPWPPWFQRNGLQMRGVGPAVGVCLTGSFPEDHLISTGLVGLPRRVRGS